MVSRGCDLVLFLAGSGRQLSLLCKATGKSLTAPTVLRTAPWYLGAHRETLVAESCAQRVAVLPFLRWKLCTFSIYFGRASAGAGFDYLHASCFSGRLYPARAINMRLMSYHKMKNLFRTLMSSNVASFLSDEVQHSARQRCHTTNSSLASLWPTMLSDGVLSGRAWIDV